MSDEKEDLLGLWKRALGAQEQQWSSLFDRALSSEAVAAEFGKVLAGYLELTRVSRENVEKQLQAANLPTRADIAALAKRIDDLSNRVEELTRALHRPTGKAAKAPAAPPRRTPRKRG